MLIRSSATLLLAAALGLSTAAQAQLKPSKGSNPLSPDAPATTTPAPAPASNAPASNAAGSPASQPAPTAKEIAAAKVAAEWLKLIDAGEYGKAWDECAPLFREKVSRQTWVENMPKGRAAHGAFKSRSFSAAAARTSLPGVPDGEYVTVRFLSDFEKAPGVEELVTMAFIAGAWRPIGYLLR